MPGSIQLLRRCALATAVLIGLLAGGCTHRRARPVATDAPVVRVLILADQSQVRIQASQPPLVHTTSHPSPRRLNFPPNASIALTLSPGGWQIGNVLLGSGVLTLRPAQEGTLWINNQLWRGEFVLVPQSSARFDVVNRLDIDSYLYSVVSKELLRDWHLEAYRAQAIVARTYALYEAKTAPAGRHFDLFPDQRSQVYGGIGAESRISVQAVDDTSGIVVAYGPDGREKIFKAYFSSCCGGVTQNVGDAFNEPILSPLTEQNVGALCNASPRFNWGPISLSKSELTRRIRAWGAKRGRAEKDMQELARIDIERMNQFGRPVRFMLTDARGARYSLGAEEMRWAINHEAGNGPIVWSSFFKPVNEPQAVQFIDGHGWGHGVGMCQWCAQVRALRGMRHEEIVLRAYPQSRLVRAY